MNPDGSDGHVACRLLTCERRSGKFCFSCDEFPCARLRRVDDRYRAKYGMSEIENLQYIKRHGIRAFVAKERARWISDDGVFCVHDGKRYPSALSRAGKGPRRLTPRAV